MLSYFYVYPVANFSKYFNMYFAVTYFNCIYMNQELLKSNYNVLKFKTLNMS